MVICSCCLDLICQCQLGLILLAFSSLLKWLTGLVRRHMRVTCDYYCYYYYPCVITVIDSSAPPTHPISSQWTRLTASTSRAFYTRSHRPKMWRGESWTCVCVCVCVDVWVCRSVLTPDEGLSCFMCVRVCARAFNHENSSLTVRWQLRCDDRWFDSSP